jgi:hypothetical protein
MQDLTHETMEHLRQVLAETGDAQVTVHIPPELDGKAQAAVWEQLGAASAVRCTFTTEPLPRIDTPAQHWGWLLEDACYLVSRGVRPVADVEISAGEDAAQEARRVAGVHGLQIRIEQPLDEHGKPWRDPAGQEVCSAVVARHEWALRLYAIVTTLGRQDAVALAGLLHGYSGDKIDEFLRRQAEEENIDA